jgi:hypothetical protein
VDHYVLTRGPASGKLVPSVFKAMSDMPNAVLREIARRNGVSCSPKLCSTNAPLIALLQQLDGSLPTYILTK